MSVIRKEMKLNVCHKALTIPCVRGLKTNLSPCLSVRREVSLTVDIILRRVQVRLGQLIWELKRHDDMRWNPNNNGIDFNP